MNDDQIFMPFPKPLINATFLKRPQRFLAERLLSDNSQVTAYCANPGAVEINLKTITYSMFLLDFFGKSIFFYLLPSFLPSFC
jgi:hypothetical protein